MKRRNHLFFLATPAIFYACITLLSSCAQVGMPTGGLKDTLPPLILKITPPENTTGFSDNRIIITFDEYVQLQDLQTNLLVSPVPKRNPSVDFRLKTVTIRLRDTLDKNTTYKIGLGNAIRDINENNPIPDFTYVFSTGTYIDSLTFSGNVEVAETGQADSTLFVFLYNDLSDSAVFKSKPKYITKVNNKGDFRFTNLPPGTYHAFALKDESGQRIYAAKTQLFAFLDSAIILPTSTPVKMYAFAEEKEAPKSTAAAPKAGEPLKFTSSMSGNVQDLLTPLKLTFNYPLKSIDVNHISLSDTLYNKIPFQATIMDTLNKQVTISVDWADNFAYRLIVDTLFATDTIGHHLAKQDTLSFKTKKEGDYGSLKISFKNLEKFTHPVLQFVKNKEVVKSYPLTGATFFARLFEPGDYEIRILEDDNQNGQWDPGHYDPVHKSLQKQPEKVITITQPLNIRAGWDNERDIIL